MAELIALDSCAAPPATDSRRLPGSHPCRSVRPTRAIGPFATFRMATSGAGKEPQTKAPPTTKHVVTGISEPAWSAGGAARVIEEGLPTSRR